LSYKYYKSGEGDNSYYRIEEENGVFYVKKKTRKVWGTSQYEESLGETRSMKDAFSLIQARSGVSKITQVT